MNTSTQIPMDWPETQKIALEMAKSQQSRGGRKTEQEIISSSFHSAWTDASEECAKIGLAGIADSKAATKLLMDLLPYPKQSCHRTPHNEANINWLAHSLAASADIAKKAGQPAWAQARWSSATPYPLLFAKARIARLGALGADPVASKALLRASFRKSTEEIGAVLGLPNCPAPGLCYPPAASPLHKACYSGPNDCFASLAMASKPADWIELNSDGLLPLDKAYQSDNLNRALAAAIMTPLNLAGANAKGDTPLHRLAHHLASKGPSFDALASGWIGLLERIASHFGPDAFFVKNNKGLTPIQCAGFPAAQQAMLTRHAQNLKTELSHFCPETPEQTCETKPRKRL